MDESQSAVTHLLERAAGPVGPPQVEMLLVAGRRRTRNRRITQGVATFAVIAAVLGTTLPFAFSSKSHFVPTPVGPALATASELTHGVWQRMSDAPFNRCDPEAYTSTGPGLALVQPGRDGCLAAAGIYDARTNRWRRIAAPPSFLNPRQQLAWSGSSLLALPAAGEQIYEWSGGTNTWQPLPALPGGFTAPTGATWWQHGWLVVSATGQLATFGGGSWHRLTSLPTPNGYQPVQPVVADLTGQLLASATDIEVRRHGNSSSEHWRPVVLAWTGRRWQTLAAGHGLPAAPSQLLALGNAVLVLGGSCPPGAYCPATTGGPVAALVRPAGRLTPPLPLAPLAAAPNGTVLVSVNPDSRAGTQIYDASAHTWATGPQLHLHQHEGSYGDGGTVWTEAGVITLVVSTNDLRHPGNDKREFGYILKPSATVPSPSRHSPSESAGAGRVFSIGASPILHQDVTRCTSRRAVAHSDVATSLPGGLGVTLRPSATRATAEAIARCLRSLSGPELTVTIGTTRSHVK